MKITKLYLGLTLFVFFALLALSFSYATERPDKDKSARVSSVEGVTGLPRWTILNINNLTTWIRSDGEGNHSPTGDNGVYYPIGTGNVVYEDNLVFGGKMFKDAAKTQPATLQPVRINGGSYLSNHGMSAGWVTGQGASAVAVDPGDPSVRCYRIRRDYTVMSETELKRDAQTYYELSSLNDVSEAQTKAITAQYEKDWKEWPVSKGGPYIERNGQPGYQAPPDFSATFGPDDLIKGNYDEPGVAGVNPNSPADQVLFTVFNGLDPSKATVFEGSEPIGIEVQKTVWGYKRTDALGNLYFTRYRLINKGGIDIGGGTKGAWYIDSMFVNQWSDIDLGNAGDDLAGCDSTLSMAFVYNGAAVDNTFIRFGLPPPASGYDFLAGPLISAPGDSGVFDFKRVRGRKNLGMSSFAYFSAGSQYTDPPFRNYSTGTGQWWAMLRGYAPIGTITDAPTPYNFPPGLPTSKFPLSGDPSQAASATNFIDGQGTLYSFAPGDRRILLNTGPFTMAPGDTQEVYMGFVVGIGGDRLSSVAVMKANDRAVQSTFDILFQVTAPPTNPNVKVTELDGEIILDWGSDLTRVKDTETRINTPGDYAFQGYNVYQFPSAGSSISDAKRLATYDVKDGIKVVFDNIFDIAGGRFVDKPIQFGSDFGVNRYYHVTRDAIRDIDKLWNGQEYYFGVTAYSYTDVVGYTHALESSPNILTIRPKNPLGTRYTEKFGDLVNVTTVTGAPDYKPVVFMVDPIKALNTTYQLTFKDTADGLWWIFKDKNANRELYRSGNLGSNVSEDPADDARFPIINGLLLNVIAQAQKIRSDSSTWRNPGQPPQIDVADTRYSGGPAVLGATIASDLPNYLGHVASSFPMSKLTRVAIRFGAANASKAYRLRRTGPGASYVLQINVLPAAPNGEPFVTVPFSAWDLDNPGGPRQLTVAWRDQAGDALWNPPEGGDGVEVIFVYNKTYDPNGRQFTYPANPSKPGPVVADEATVGALADIMYGLSFAGGPGGISGAPNSVSAGELYLRPVLGFNSSLVFEFSTLGPTTTPNVQKSDAEARVGVFPNPYYAFNPAESSRFDRFVTFNNLPPEATIRIFNLAGQLLRTLRKSDPSQFLRWNLNNESNYPVASGLYLCYIELPNLGVTKILKVAIIQEQEILDIY